MDKTLCGTIRYIRNKNPYRVDCGVKNIREITILKEYNMILSDMALTLCEVEVYSKHPPGEFYV